MPNKIQLGEYSKGGDTGGISHNSDDDPNLLSANRNDDGQRLNANYDKPDNKWNRDSGFAFVVVQLFSFLSQCFIGRVFFFRINLAKPST
jgi:hypothetical protein